VAAHPHDAVPLPKTLLGHQALNAFASSRDPSSAIASEEPQHPARSASPRFQLHPRGV